VFCWELATVLRNQLSTLEANNIKLVAVGIGDVEKARAFCEETGFPAANLFSDTGETYKALGFRKGLQDTFFRPETPQALQNRVQKGSNKELSEVLPRYAQAWQRDGTKWLPPDFQRGISAGLEQGLQQGGQFVFKGKDVIFAHVDPGTAAHADLGELLEAARADGSKDD